MRTILLIILILLLLGAFPTWPYSTGWGYYPSGGMGLVLLIVVILALTGRVCNIARKKEDAKRLRIPQTCFQRGLWPLSFLVSDSPRSNQRRKIR